MYHLLLQRVVQKIASYQSFVQKGVGLHTYTYNTYISCYIFITASINLLFQTINYITFILNRLINDSRKSLFSMILTNFIFITFLYKYFCIIFSLFLFLYYIILIFYLKPPKSLFSKFGNFLVYDIFIFQKSLKISSSLLLRIIFFF